MTPALEQAIRLLEQSRRELAALIPEGNATQRPGEPSLFETLLDIGEASSRHEAALAELRARLEDIERRHRR